MAGAVCRARARTRAARAPPIQPKKRRFEPSPPACGLLFFPSRPAAMCGGRDWTNVMKISLLLVQGAAWLHLCQLPGMWLMSRRIVDVARELPRLSPLAAGVVRVMALAVLVLLMALGMLVATYPEDVLTTRFGRALVVFLGAFWGVRGLVQLWYYGMLAWPRTALGRRLHTALVVVFTLQCVGYLAAFTLVDGAAHVEARR
jgi:hypothetical protein